MTQQEEIELKFQNLVKHEPIRYVVKKHILLWYVEDLNGNWVDVQIFKSHAEVKCTMYNAIYSLGYTIGVEAAVKTFFNT